MTSAIHALSDKPQYTDICAAWSFAEWGCHNQNSSLEDALNGYRAAASNSHDLPQTWILLDEGQPAGTISLRESDHPDHQDLSPWIASFFVHPHFRGRGHSSRLLQHAEQKVLSMAFKKAYLYTPDAEGLYQKHNWNTVERVRDPSGLHPHVTLMTKTFQNSEIR
ncbi:MAG: GNAT family N-acetyltransferase [Alphaproteobacteria bacterium]